MGSETSPAGTTDRDKLNAAFVEFRALGYWARVNQQDGWNAVPQDVLKRQGKVIFWDARETPVAFDSEGRLRRPLHVQHLHRDAEEIARLLKQHGLLVEIFVVPGDSVVVMPDAA